MGIQARLLESESAPQAVSPPDPPGPVSIAFTPRPRAGHPRREAWIVIPSSSGSVGASSPIRRNEAVPHSERQRPFCPGWKRPSPRMCPTSLRPSADSIGTWPSLVTFWSSVSPKRLHSLNPSTTLPCTMPPTSSSWCRLRGSATACDATPTGLIVAWRSSSVATLTLFSTANGAPCGSSQTYCAPDAGWWASGSGSWSWTGCGTTHGTRSSVLF